MLTFFLVWRTEKKKKNHGVQGRLTKRKKKVDLFTPFCPTIAERQEKLKFINNKTRKKEDNKLKQTKKKFKSSKSSKKKSIYIHTTQI